MSHRSARLRELFDEAIGLPVDERAAFLDERCADDPDLRRELELLMQHDEGSYLAAPFVEFGASAASAEVGTSVAGRYTLERVLGEGGMGVVWLARQENPEREVALKLIRPGFVGRELLRRFELEAAVLGRLSHPGIAQIHEAGMFDDGSGARPFFAMELVDGLPLTAYASENGLDTRARLELFSRVCEAVHHAHQKGVIHRDLKPANILVTKGDDPKVLDFGVARVTDSDVQATTLKTDVGQLLGTLAYMSPEQVEGRTTSLDTRSDVYALGVVLYELLGERLPHDVKDLSIAKAARVITESDPVPLSSVSRMYRGDLNTIVQKALESDPDRRYQSAADLGADVRRYLDDQPIVARPTTTLYQLRKFAKRNKPLVAGVAAAVLALVAGLVGTTLGMLRAQDSASKALAMNEFMRGVLVLADADKGRPDIQLVEVLRQASDAASAKFAEHPELEAEMRHLLGLSFGALANFDEAETHLERAFEVRRARLGMTHALTRRTACDYAQMLIFNMRFDAAAPLAHEVLEHTPKGEMRDDVALETRRLIGVMKGHRGDRDEAIVELSEVLETARASLGADHETALRTALNLAGALRVRATRRESPEPDHDLDEAISLFRDVFERRRRTLGEDERETLFAEQRLAHALHYRGRLDEAGAMLEDVLERSGRFGPDHSLRSGAQETLAAIRFVQGRYEQSADLMVGVVEAARRREGADSVRAMSLQSDALPKFAAGDRATIGAECARDLYQRFRAMGGAHGGELTSTYQLYLAHFLSRQGLVEEADRHFGEILAAAPDGEEVQHREFNVFYAVHLASRARFDEAENRLLAVLEGEERIEPEHWLAGLARREIVALYEARDGPERAERWREAGD